MFLIKIGFGLYTISIKHAVNSQIYASVNYFAEIVYHGLLIRYFLLLNCQLIIFLRSPKSTVNRLKDHFQGKMALQPFRDEQLNYFKFASIVLDEFPKALRQTFTSMWDNTLTHLPGHQPWDDSAAVRNKFLTSEGGPGRTKVPTNLSYEEWDCTALFQATIYAKSFALPDSGGHHKTLCELFVKPRKLAHGVFHASVTSPSGNNAETVALAIDQVRLLRNSLFHSHTSEITKATFDQYVKHAKDAFEALGVKTDPIDIIGGLTESEFPTNKVRKLEEYIKEENRAFVSFLQQQNQHLEGISSDVKALKHKMEVMPTKDDIFKMLEQIIKDLIQAPAQNKPGKCMFSFDKCLIHVTRIQKSFTCPDDG